MLLDFFAHTHTPYLYARGSQGTRVLLNELQPLPGQRILEIGFGAGQTLVDMACRFPGIELYGLEKSALMLKTARQRLRFCGLPGIRLELYNHLLPFEDGFFDAVCCESVLAILPDNSLPEMFREIYRVLKPGGRFCCNESLWLKTVAPETIREINQKCLETFGSVRPLPRRIFTGISKAPSTLNAECFPSDSTSGNAVRIVPFRPAGSLHRPGPAGRNGWPDSRSVRILHVLWSRTRQ